MGAPMPARGGDGEPPEVRERLIKRSAWRFPTDTHFVAGQAGHHDRQRPAVPTSKTCRRHTARTSPGCTTTSREAGRQLTRQSALPAPRRQRHPTGCPGGPSMWTAVSADWSQVRPEWGLSSNTAFIIGRRDLTKDLTSSGRVFLALLRPPRGSQLAAARHAGTAPQARGAVDQYGALLLEPPDNDVLRQRQQDLPQRGRAASGSCPAPGAISAWGWRGSRSLNGELPYHEPMRLLTVVDASRATIES